MTVAEEQIAQALIAHQLDLLRLGAYTQTQALRLIEELARQMRGMLAVPGLTEFGRKRINDLLGQVDEAIRDYYLRIAAATNVAMEAAARSSAMVVTTALQNTLLITTGSAIPSTTFFRVLMSNALIHGAPSRNWWAKQSEDLQFRFANALRQGLIAGETTPQIVNRVLGTSTQPGVLQVSRTHARALVHSSIQTVANEARLETFRRMGDVVKGVRQLSTLDSHTTEICIAYANQEWDLEGKPLGRTSLPFNGGPPRHWNCRSVLVPILKTFRELGLRIPELPRLFPRFASEGGPTNLTMKQWLKTRTPEQLDEQLGRGRAKLFRAGKITTQQLLDLRGNPLTVAQLNRKYS